MRYLPLLLLLSSCSFNISMAHTEGTATDTIDDTQKTDAVVSPKVTIPVKAI